MSDYNSSLPIRTEAAGDVEVKIVDGTITSRKLTVNADGSINTNISGGSITISSEVEVKNDAGNPIPVNGTVEIGATSLAALESITVQNGSGVAAVNIQDGGNSITVDGSVSISGTPTVELGSTSLAALESITVQNGAGASAVNIQDGGNSITVDGSVSITGTPTVELGATSLAALESITVQNGSGASAVNIQDGGNSITVDSTNLDIRNLTAARDTVKLSDGTNALVINSDGSLNVRQDLPTTTVRDYNTVASVAAGASSTHTYTSTGNFYLRQILASASGKLKIEVQVNGTTVLVQFNSTSEPNMNIPLQDAILVTSAQTVTVIRTNRDNQAMDVYSTICGRLE